MEDKKQLTNNNQTNDEDENKLKSNDLEHELSDDKINDILDVIINKSKIVETFDSNELITQDNLQVNEIIQNNDDLIIDAIILEALKENSDLCERNLQKAFQEPTQFIKEMNLDEFISSQLITNYSFNENAIALTQAFTETEHFLRETNHENEMIKTTFDINTFIQSQIVHENDDEMQQMPKNLQSEFDSQENLSDGDKKLRIAFNNISRDRTLLYCGKIIRDEPPELRKNYVLHKIRNIFRNLNQDINEGRCLVLKFRNLRIWRNVSFVNDRLTMKPVHEAIITSIRQKSKHSENNFKLIIYLLKKMLNLVSLNATCTKREIYYQIIKFVTSQTKVDNAVIRISCMLEIPPWDLGILTTSKGIIYGDLNIIITEEEVIHCNIKGGTLIPQDLRRIKRITSNAYFILIVEKDSIFQKLLDEDVPNKLSRPFLLITGKGYADMNTRLFLNKLWKLLSIPVFILVDADPHGIEIMLTYRFGSLATSFLSNHLAIPNIRWIGVLPSEIDMLQIDHQPLTDADVAKIGDILKRPYIEAYPRIERELKDMLKYNRKAEIEGLIKCHQFLSNFYLPNKFYAKEFL